MKVNDGGSQSAPSKVHYLCCFQIYLVILAQKRKLSIPDLNSPDLPSPKRAHITVATELSAPTIDGKCHIILLYAYSKAVGPVPQKMALTSKQQNSLAAVSQSRDFPSSPDRQTQRRPASLSFGEHTPQPSFDQPYHQSPPFSENRRPSVPPSLGEPEKRLLPPSPFGEPDQRCSASLSFGEHAPQPSFGQSDHPSPPFSENRRPSVLPSFREPEKRLLPPSPFGEPSLGQPGPLPSPLLSSRENKQSSAFSSFGEPAAQPLSFGHPGRSFLPFREHQRPPAHVLQTPFGPLPSSAEKQRPSVHPFGIFGGATCSTTISISEVEHASLEHTARRRMAFHYLRLSAALKAFQNDTQIDRQQWWMRNLKFELVWTQLLTYQHSLMMHAGRVTR